MKNTLSLTESEMETLFPDKQTQEMVDFHNKHIHWVMKSGFCKLCGELIPFEERVNKDKQER